MAHEITSFDSVLTTNGQQAWHGLGLTIEGDTTPVDGCKRIGMDWEVEQWALSATNGEGIKLAVTEKVANVRKDTKQVLGIVGADWVPVQPLELAQLAEDLAVGGDVVKVETCGSIMGGKKFWILLKGNSFAVRGKDEINPYIALTSGFDGLTATRATFTDVRVVCKNTLSRVIPMSDSRDRSSSSQIRTKDQGFVFSHVGKVSERLIECRAALGLYMESESVTRQYIDHLSATELNNEQVNRFLLQMYCKHFGEVADQPENEKEEKKRDKAMLAIATMIKRFERESDIAGTTAWNALNSYTGWLQHDRHNRMASGDQRTARAASRLFGSDADRSTQALTAALNLAS